MLHTKVSLAPLSETNGFVSSRQVREHSLSLFTMTTVAVHEPRSKNASLTIQNPLPVTSTFHWYVAIGCKLAVISYERCQRQLFRRFFSFSSPRSPVPISMFTPNSFHTLTLPRSVDFNQDYLHSVDSYEIAQTLLPDILADLEAFTVEAPKVDTFSTGSTIAPGEWASFAKNGSFFTRHNKDREGDVFKERIRLWCDGNYINWCDAKMPQNIADPSRQIHIRKILEIFLGTQAGQVLYTDDAIERNCFTIKTSRITLSVEADNFDDRQAWWSEFKRYMRSAGDATSSSSGPGTPSRRGSLAPTDRRPSISATRRPSMAGTSSDSRPTTPTGSRRSSTMEGSSAAAAAASADRARKEAEEEAERDRARYEKKEAAERREAEKQGSIAAALKDLSNGSSFMLYTEEAGRIVGIPIVLFWVQDASHPPPGAVYWVEQENGALELFPDRRIDVKGFIKVERGKFTRELRSEAAKDASPNDCVTFHFADNVALNLHGIAMNIKLWTNALQALQLASQAETIGKKELRTQREEQQMVTELVTERKQAEEKSQRLGFALAPGMKAEDMLATVKKQMDKLAHAAKLNNKMLRPKFNELIRSLNQITFENTILSCMPPRSPGEVTLEMSWYQTVMDVRYGIRSSVIGTNTDDRPWTITKDDINETVRLSSYSGIGPTLAPKRNEYVSVDFKDYAPKVFSLLRTAHGISVANFVDELVTTEPVIHLAINKDKCGSNLRFAERFYWYSQTGQYIVKGVSEEAFRFFLSYLDKYFAHLVNNAGDSFLPRIFGMYRVRNSQRHDPIYLMVMKNHFWGPNRPQTRWEIKGSKTGRTASETERTNPVPVLKDNDFTENNMLFVRPEQKELIMAQVKRDVDFLASINVMDYAFHVGIHNKDNAKNFPREPTKLLSFLGLRDKDCEIAAYNDDMAVMSDDMKDQFEDIDKLKGFLPIPVMEVNDNIKVSNWTLDAGGVVSASWDRRRKVHKAANETFFMGFTGIFTEFGMSKKSENWWKRNDHDRTCKPPMEYAERLLKRIETMINYENDQFSREAAAKAATKKNKVKASTADSTGDVAPA